MAIDTDGLCSVGCDHNSNRLTFGGHRALPTKGPRVLPDQATEEAVDGLEEDAERVSMQTLRNGFKWHCKRYTKRERVR